MNSELQSAQPPRAAAWLINVFSPAGVAQSLLGDLLEEFSHVASKSGVPSARRWYWRQTVHTVPHLVGAGFRTAPWTISGVVVGGFLLRWLFSSWSRPAVLRAIEGLMEKYQPDPHTYIFLLKNSMMIEHLFVNLLIGCVVALVANGRELTAAISLALLSDILAVQATWTTLAQTGDRGIIWTLPWSFAFSVAVVAGAVIVRTGRAAPPASPA